MGGAFGSLLSGGIQGAGGMAMIGQKKKQGDEFREAMLEALKNISYGQPQIGNAYFRGPTTNPQEDIFSQYW